MRLARSVEETCERVREQLSLALDGELSELGSLHVQSHLNGCPDCRAFAARTRAATEILRTSEPEEPAVPFVLPRTRRLPGRILGAGAAAAAIALVAALSTLNDVGERQSEAQPFRLSPTVMFDHNDEVAPIRQVRVRPIQRLPL
jgi:anti-sigma factor RsiW